MEKRSSSSRCFSIQLSRRNSYAHVEEAVNEEEALIWAAIEKLPTYDQLRTGILRSCVVEDKKDIENNSDYQGLQCKQVDVRKLDSTERYAFIDRSFKIAAEDNEKFLTKFRDRIDRVGIRLPTVEIRFEHLTVEANVYVGDRALPTLLNAARNIAESALELIGIKLAKRTKLTILKDASGIIKPSRMTLLLGPPSSGKTTLLQALAGRLDPSLKVNGEITYNGHKLNEFVPQKTSAYISQGDVHLGEMTVKETLDFSARCQGIGYKYDLLVELIEREKNSKIFTDSDVDLLIKGSSVEGLQSNLHTDYILKILGLDICKDTIVGDQMHRGVSGGQRKRVTTGEMMVGPVKVMLMDEISTGLDSSTTYQIVKCLQQIVHLTESTALVSLLQPPPETFDLFDDIILLTEGLIVYQGPRDRVLEFFENCGFQCPQRKGTADFLQEVTSRKDQEQYWTDSNKPYRFVSVTEFADRFKQFHVGLILHNNELSVPFNKKNNHRAALVFTKYTVPIMDILKANFAKEWLLIKRNSFVYISRIVQIVFLAVVGSTVFLKTEMDTKNEEDGRLYIGALLYAMNTSMFSGIPEMAITIMRLPILYKQRDLHFYPPWTFTLPNFLLQIPISLLESTIWVLLTYYPVGFAPDVSRFFQQLLLIFLIQQMAAGVFRFIAGITRTMVIANTAGSLILLIMFMLGGFILPLVEIPKWWVWGYWISPLSYAFNALTVNEMSAPRWMNKLASDNFTRLGIAVLDDLDVYPQSYWVWIGAAVLLGFVLLFNFLFTVTLMYLNPLGKPQAIIPKELADELNLKQPATDEESRFQRSKSKGNSIPQSLSAEDENAFREMANRRISSGLNASFLSRRADSVGEEINGVSPKRGMILPFMPLAMSFENINYYVNMPQELKAQGVPENRLQLLREVTGAFRPGVLTALMGVSGAGKTTLMDVLSGRKTGGYIEGDIRISGFPKKQETFARISGYCEQNDIHSPQVTVGESLIYSAFLRLPKEVSKKEKDGKSSDVFVHEVMQLVELENLKDSIVGLPGITGLSTEQRKRLTIAVELVANPSIIFMDEPTSGLDARAAAIVMRTVRNTVDTGRTVVCTIHQPSIDIFEAFDELLLMKTGGQVIYSGPLGLNSHKIVEYFEAVPGVSRIKDKYNPATWILEASSIATEAQLGIDFAEYYQMSSLYQRNKALVKELRTPPPGAEDLYFPTQYSQSIWEQFKSCLWKQWWTYWRSPDYNISKILFTLTTAIILGTIFWKIGTKMENSTDLLIIIGAMYSSVLFIGINNCTSVLPVVATERTVFYRERAAGMYSALPYAIAQVVVEIPYIFVQTICYTLIVYAMVSFQWTAPKFLWFFFINLFTFFYFTYYGMMSTSITPNHQVAAIYASTFYGLFNLFSGFFIPRKRIPKWWVWYYWICPMAWTVYGLIVTQYGDSEDMIKVPGSEDQMVKDYINNHFGFDRDFMGPVSAVLVAFTVFFACMYAICIKILNFQQR